MKSFCKRLGFLLFLSLAVLVLGEMLTRRFIPIHPETRILDRSSEHPHLRTDWVPGFRTTYAIDGIAGQKGTMEFKINEFGFRSSSMKTAHKPPGTYRIFFLGESTTESIYLPEEKTFPYLVEKKLLEDFPTKKFESINGGISGYLTADTLAALLYKVMYYEPDLVIVMQAANDLRYGTVPTYDPIRRSDYQKILYRPNYHESLSSLLAQILRRSHFLTLIKWRLINPLFPPEAEKYKTKLDQYNAWRRQRRAHPFTSISESKAAGDFTKNLEEIIFTLQGHGVRTIFMTEPFVYQENLPPEMDEKLWMGWLMKEGRPLGINLSPEFLLREMKRFNDIIRALTEKHGIELIDLEKEIPKDLEHFYDDVHLTPLGSQRAAEVIATYLIRRPEKITPS